MVLGYKPAEVLGTSVTRLMQPNDVLLLKDLMIMLLTGQHQRCMGRLRMITHDGELVWVEMRVCVMPAAVPGGPSSLMCTVALLSFLQEFGSIVPVECIAKVSVSSNPAHAVLPWIPPFLPHSPTLTHSHAPCLLRSLALPPPHPAASGRHGCQGDCTGRVRKVRRRPGRSSAPGRESRLFVDRAHGRGWPGTFTSVRCEDRGQDLLTLPAFHPTAGIGHALDGGHVGRDLPPLHRHRRLCGLVDAGQLREAPTGILDLFARYMFGL